MPLLINAQSDVKVCGFKKTLNFLIISFIIFPLSTLQASPQFDMDDVLDKFGAGVNISHYEHTWKQAEELLDNDITNKIMDIAEKGFKTIRLPVAFDMFIEGGYNINPKLIAQLKKILIKTYELQMKLIITYHYGKLNDSNVFSGDMDRVINTWKQMQTIFKGNAYEDLFFELYNEPTLSSLNWKYAISTIVTELRKEDDKRIYIVGGADYNSMNELMYMGKLSDDRIIYTFHFYEPFIFTHQGADWTDNKTNLTGIPFPYKRRKMPKLYDAAKGTSVEQDYNKYPDEGTESYIKSRVKEIYEYCKKNKMPVICTETGVIISCDIDYRKNYLQCITKATRKKDIKTMVWDYDQQFAIEGADNVSVVKALRRWIRKSK